MVGVGVDLTSSSAGTDVPSVDDDADADLEVWEGERIDGVGVVAALPSDHGEARGDEELKARSRFGGEGGAAPGGNGSAAEWG